MLILEGGVDIGDEGRPTRAADLVLTLRADVVDLPLLQDKPLADRLECVVLACDPVAHKADDPESSGPEPLDGLERPQVPVLRTDLRWQSAGFGSFAAFED